MPRLSFPGGDPAPVELKPGANLVGRVKECDVVVTNGDLSRKHAQLTLDPSGSVVVEDLGSRNGTFVNGERVEGKVALAPGDKVRFGQVEAVLEAAGEAAPSKAETRRRDSPKEKPSKPPKAPEKREGDDDVKSDAGSSDKPAKAEKKEKPEKPEKLEKEKSEKPDKPDKEKSEKPDKPEKEKSEKPEKLEKEKSEKPDKLDRDKIVEPDVPAVDPKKPLIQVSPATTEEAAISGDLGATAEPVPEPSSKTATKRSGSGAERAGSAGKVKTDSGHKVKTGSAGKVKTDSAGKLKTDSAGKLKTDSAGKVKTDSAGKVRAKRGKTAPTSASGLLVLALLAAGLGGVAGAIVFRERLAGFVAKLRGGEAPVSSSTPVVLAKKSPPDEGPSIVKPPRDVPSPEPEPEASTSPEPTPSPEGPVAIETMPPKAPRPTPSPETPEDPEPVPSPSPRPPVEGPQPTPAPAVKATPSPRALTPEEKAEAELAELLRRALASDAAAKAALHKHHYVSIHHDGALGGSPAARVMAFVREKVAHDEVVRVVSPELGRALRAPALKLEVHELEVRTAYVQDYSKGLGRLIGKTRLAPHPKTVRVDFVEIPPAEGAAPRVLATYTKGTPALDVPPDSVKGLTDADVWDATIDALLKTLAPWPGKL